MLYGSRVSSGGPSPAPPGTGPRRPLPHLEDTIRACRRRRRGGDRAARSRMMLAVTHRAFDAGRGVPSGRSCPYGKRRMGRPVKLRASMRTTARVARRDSGPHAPRSTRRRSPGSSSAQRRLRPERAGVDTDSPRFRWSILNHPLWPGQLRDAAGCRYQDKGTYAASLALCNDQRDVVAQLLRAELLHLVDDRLEQGWKVPFPVPQQRRDETPLAKFLFGIVQRLCDAVGVEHQCVSWKESAFLHRAIPTLEDPQYGPRGVEPFNAVVPPEE